VAVQALALCIVHKQTLAKKANTWAKFSTLVVTIWMTWNYHAVYKYGLT